MGDRGGSDGGGGGGSIDDEVPFIKLDPELEFDAGGPDGTDGRL